MSLTTGFEVGFAAAVAVAALALGAAALRAVPRLVLGLLTTLVLGGAVAEWAVYALRHSHPRDLAVAAGGVTAAALATGASLLVAWALERAAATETHIAEAQARLLALVEAEASDRAAELERTLARARADSISLLTDEERRIAEERRVAFSDRERELANSLTEALTDVQTQVSQRLADWKRRISTAPPTRRRSGSPSSPNGSGIFSATRKRASSPTPTGSPPRARRSAKGWRGCAATSTRRSRTRSHSRARRSRRTRENAGGRCTSSKSGCAGARRS